MTMHEWQPMATLPDELKDGRPVFFLPLGSDDPVVGEWYRGGWAPVSNGRRVIEYMSDFGTDYADLTPEYWCRVPAFPKSPAT